MRQIVQKSINWTWRQLESLHELLPHMSDVERRHALAVLSKQATELWGQVSALFGLTIEQLQESTMILRALALIEQERSSRSVVLQELQYQRSVLPLGIIPRQVCPDPLMRILGKDHSYGFPFDISRYSLEDAGEARVRQQFRNLILHEAFSFCKAHFSNARVSQVKDTAIVLRALDEFDLEFTMIPSSARLFEWFLVRASPADSDLSARVGHSLTGMLQGRSVGKLTPALEIYRHYCFMHALYAQFLETAGIADIVVEKGPDSLKVALWGRYRVYEAKLSKRQMLELRNIPSEAIHSVCPCFDFNLK
jgi:hypothetical protein